MTKLKLKISVALCLVLCTLCMGCAMWSAQVKPGRVDTPLATQVQTHSPKDATTLATDSEKLLEYVLPAGSTITQYDPVSGTNIVMNVSASTPVRMQSRDKVDSKLGSADMSIGKLIAKLQSVKWIQGVGILLVLFGIATFAYPPLRAIVGSVTTSFMIGAAGAAMIVLPILIVGNEVLILAGCGGAAAIYFFIHRYGKKSGEVEILKKWVDKNKDGKVDPGEIV